MTTVHDEYADLYAPEPEPEAPAASPFAGGITRRMLWRLGACDNQRERFTETFGPRAVVTITEANAIRAADAGLDLWWISCRLLMTTRAIVAFEAVVARANSERDALSDENYRLYERGEISYEETTQRWDARRRAYLREVAVAIVRAWREQEGLPPEEPAHE